MTSSSRSFVRTFALGHPFLVSERRVDQKLWPLGLVILAAQFFAGQVSRDSPLGFSFRAAKMCPGVCASPGQICSRRRAGGDLRAFGVGFRSGGLAAQHVGRAASALSLSRKPCRLVIYIKSFVRSVSRSSGYTGRHHACSLDCRATGAGYTPVDLIGRRNRSFGSRYTQLPSGNIALPCFFTSLRSGLMEDRPDTSPDAGFP